MCACVHACVLVYNHPHRPKQQLGNTTLLSVSAKPSGLRTHTNKDVVAKWLGEPVGLEMGVENGVVPVCYGGQFAVRMSNIQAVPSSVWHRLINNLQRGESIEEVHYAERTWAALFSAGTVTSRPWLVRAQIPGAHV